MGARKRLVQATRARAPPAPFVTPATRARPLSKASAPKPRQPRSSDLAITRRWIWLVPSTICSTLASRLKRSAGKSVV